MTETYQSLGQITATMFAYIGCAFIAIGGIKWIVRRAKGIRQFKEIEITLVIGGTWMILCWLLSFPMFFISIGYILGPFLAAALRLGHYKEKPRLRTTTIVLCLLCLALILGATWGTGDRKITVTDNQLSVVGAGLEAHRKDFRGSVDRKSAYFDVTDYGSTPWLDTRPFKEWRIGAPKKSTSDIYIIGDTVYLGPRGLISSDALGKRIADWAGATPHEHAFSYSDSE